MANINNSVSRTVIDSFLPKFGTPQQNNTPRYNAESKAFFSDEYQSKAGHYYYKLVRFSSQIAMVEKVGHYYNWKYLDSVAIYAYDGMQMKLISEREFDKQFYDAELAKKTAIELLDDYLREQASLQGMIYEKGMAPQIIEQTYSVRDLVCGIAESSQRDYYKLLEK